MRIRTFSTTTLPSVEFDLPIISVQQGEIADVVTTFGLGVLQAVVLIAALQIAFAPIQAYRAWPRGAPIRNVMLGVESVLDRVPGRFRDPASTSPPTTTCCSGPAGRPGHRACS